jgi:hypothetical protein
MRFLTYGTFLLGLLAGPTGSHAVSLALSDGPTGRGISLPSAPLEPAYIELAASAYTSTPPASTTTPPPSTTTPPSAAGASTAPAGGSSAPSISTPAATTNPPPATTGQTTGGDAGKTNGAPAAPATAGTDAGTPAPTVYKPPSVEEAPGGIMIYRGSGSP